MLPDTQPLLPIESIADLVTSKETIAYDDLIDDLQFLLPDVPYFALITVDTKRLGNRLMDDLLALHHPFLVEDPEAIISDFSEVLRKKRTETIIVPLFRLEKYTSNVIAQTLIGPRDAITYNNVHIIVIVSLDTYKSIFEQAFDLISFANFKTAFHDELAIIEQDLDFPVFESQNDKDYKEAKEDLENYRQQKNISEKILLQKLERVCFVSYDLAYYDETIILAKEMSVLAKRNHLLGYRISGLLLLGLCYKTRGNLIERDKTFNKALELSNKSGFEVYKIRLLLEIGIIFRDGCNWVQAIQYFVESLNLSRKLTHDFYQALVLNDLSFLYLTKNNFNLALNYCYEAHKIAQRSKNNSEIAHSLGNLGQIAKNKCDFFEAFKNNRLSLELYKKEKSFINISISLIEIANIYSDMGDLKQALIYDNKAFEIADDLAAEQPKMVTLSNIGVIYILKGEYEKALENFQIGLQYSRKSGQKQNEANDCINISNVFIEIEDLDKAQFYTNEAEKINESIQIPTISMTILSQKGEIALKKQEYEKALENFIKALKIANEIEIPSRQAEVLENISKVYQAQGNLEEAKNYSKKAQNIAREIKSIKLEQISLTNLGKISLLEHDTDEAKKYFNEALRIATTIGNGKKIRELKQQIADIST